MFFHTKIKWTIDAENTEIFFRERHLILARVNNAANEMNNDEFNINECFSNSTFHNEVYKDKGDDKLSFLFVKTEEFSKTINYDLVVFEDSNPKQYWKRKTFSGLLIFKNAGMQVLLTLQHLSCDFDDCGRAAATYSVKGKLNKDDFEPDMINIEDGERIILGSQLLFEGEIRLVQE